MNVPPVILVILALCLGPVGAARAELDPDFVSLADSEVLAMMPLAPGRTLLSGGFSRWGGWDRGRAAVIGRGGVFDELFDPAVDDTIFTTAEQDDGGILLGGSFSSVSGQARTMLARLLADGSPDSTFAPAVDKVVRSLAIQPDGKILIGGEFTTVGGVLRRYLARLHPDGSLDTGFSALTGGTVSQISVLPDGKILAGGLITRPVRLNSDGSADLSFNPPYNLDVNTPFAVDDSGRVLLFQNDSVGQLSGARLIRLASDGGVDPAFSCPVFFAQTEKSLAIQEDGKILAGSLMRIGTVLGWSLARVGPTGTVETLLVDRANNDIKSIVLDEVGGVLLAGEFTTLDEEPAANVGRLLPDAPVQDLLSAADPTRITWSRAGSLPDFQHVSFELGDGSAWQPLGQAVRVEGGWELTGLSLPASGWVRARGRSQAVSSSWVTERTIALGAAKPVLAVTRADGSGLVSGETFLDAGTAAWMTSAAPVTVVLRNAGTMPLNGLNLSVTGNDAGDFLVTGPLDESVGAGESTTFTVTFQPRGGETRDATIEIRSSDLTQTPFHLLVKGHGIHRDPAFISGTIANVSSMVPLPDGRVLLSGPDVRLNGDGSADRSWVGIPGTSRTCAIQPDGKVLWGGRDFYTSSGTRTGLIRVNANGVLETAFNPQISFPEVKCLALQPDGKILIGGSFSSIAGTNRRGLARLHPNGSLDSSFNAMVANGEIADIAFDDNGKLLVTGSFTSIGGTTRRGMARLFPADGAVDPTFTAEFSHFNGYSVAIQADGKILAGADFSGPDGISRPGLCRMLPSGAVDPDFVEVRFARNKPVLAIALQADGRILIGGDFTFVHGRGRSRLARLEADGTLDPDFDPVVQGSVHGLELQNDGQILVAGNFTRAGGLPGQGVVRLPSGIPATSQLTLGGPGEIRWIRGGSVQELSRVTFEAWNGSAWSALGQAGRIPGGWQLGGLSLPENSWIRATGIPASGAWGGGAGMVRESFRYGAALPELTVGSDDLSWPSSPLPALAFGTCNWQQSETRTLTIRNTGNAPLSLISLTLEGGDARDFHVAVPAESSLAAGQSTAVAVSFIPGATGFRGTTLKIVSNDHGRNPLEIPLTGTSAAPAAGFNPGASSHVLSMVHDSSGGLMVGGAFTTFGGAPRRGLARLSAAGLLDPEFDPQVAGWVNAIAILPDRKILIGGEFSNVAGVPKKNLARLNADGSLDLSFTTEASSAVECLVVQSDGRILVGGWFYQIGGVARVGMAWLDANGVTDPSFDPYVAGPLYSIAVQEDGKFLIGGSFGKVGGQEDTPQGVHRSRIARLNPDGSVDPGFNPGANSTVQCIVLDKDGRILVGGFFGTIGGQTQPGLARLNANGIPDANFNPVVMSWVYSLLVQVDGSILVAGSAASVHTPYPSGLARILPDGTADPLFRPGPMSETVYGILQGTDGEIFAGGSFLSLGGLGRGRFARLPAAASATQSLEISASKARWLRGGNLPEYSRVSFDHWNGEAWVSLGAGSRIAGGWESPAFSPLAGSWIRTRMNAKGGKNNGSGSPVEWIAPYGDSRPTSPLERWRQDSFGIPYRAGLAADTADADADGLQNLLEYALGTSPQDPSSAPALSLQKSGGQSFLQLQWTRPAGRTDVEITGQVALRPGEWTSSAGEVITLVEPEGDTEKVTVRDLFPVGAHPSRFLRVTAERQP